MQIDAKLSYSVGKSTDSMELLDSCLSLYRENYNFARAKKIMLPICYVTKTQSLFCLQLKRRVREIFYLILNECTHMCSAHWQYALKRRLTQRGLRCSQTQSSKHVCTAQNEKRTIWVSGSNTFYLILFSSGARVISQFLSPFWEEKNQLSRLM